MRKNKGRPHDRGGFGPKDRTSKRHRQRSFARHVLDLIRIETAFRSDDDTDASWSDRGKRGAQALRRFLVKEKCQPGKLLDGFRIGNGREPGAA
jgi:hypothetical protein